MYFIIIFLIIQHAPAFKWPSLEVTYTEYL